jgi:hypothetical protein
MKKALMKLRVDAIIPKKRQIKKTQWQTKGKNTLAGISFSQSLSLSLAASFSNDAILEHNLELV